MKAAAPSDSVPMSDVHPHKHIDPAASLGVNVPKKKKQLSHAAKRRKQKAIDKGDAVRERTLAKSAKKLAKKSEKEKWSTLY